MAYDRQQKTSWVRANTHLYTEPDGERESQDDEEQGGEDKQPLTGPEPGGLDT